MVGALFDYEVRELARLYPPSLTTVNKLQRAGFDVTLLPSISSVGNARNYWSLINDDVANGVVENGRQLLLAMAREDFRFNQVLFGRVRPATWEVVLMGATPAGLDPLRPDQEYRGIHAIGAGIDVRYHPLAAADDVSELVQRHPHVLHLACHGRGYELTFDDGSGGPHVVHAEDLAGALREHERIESRRLYGIVLNACDTALAAEALRPCADAIIAHSSDLSDDEALEFAVTFYRTLVTSESLADAAAITKARLVMRDAALRRMAREVVVLPGTPG